MKMGGRFFYGYFVHDYHLYSSINIFYHKLQSNLSITTEFAAIMPPHSDIKSGYDNLKLTHLRGK